jgi:hypothetical protein
MKVLAVGRPRVGIDLRREIAPHVRKELTALWQLYASGTVREMYSPGGPGSILLLEVDTTDAARETLASLPLVANGIIDFELIELHPFGALDSLFSQGEDT